MDGKLKEILKNSIDRREVTRNMLLLGLVNLDEKMKYFNEKLQRLESDRKILIDTALNHGIDIEEINEQLWQIDPDKNEITNEVLAALIKLCGEEHRIGNECVRDELIKLKDVNTSTKSDAKEHKPGLKQTDRAADNDQRGFLELCDYIGQELWGTELDTSQRKKLKELCKETSYSYLVILRSFQFGTPEIRDLDRGSSSIRNSGRCGKCDCYFGRDYVKCDSWNSTDCESRAIAGKSETAFRARGKGAARWKSGFDSGTRDYSWR